MSAIAAAGDSDAQSGPRSRKGVQTRARLLDAAKEIFEENGFLEARITDIAERAGLSHGAFYHYFDSKESLFREIAEEVEVRLVAMDDIADEAGPGAGPIDRIRAANRSYLSAYRKEARIMRVIEEVSRYDDEVLKRFPEWDVDYENAKLSPTSTVRGWETLPVFTGRTS